MVARLIPGESVPKPCCTVCEGELGATLWVREMMQGRRERFPYRACGACGCVQLTAPPADIAAYYGQGYYSFAGASGGTLGRRLRASRRLAAWLSAASVRAIRRCSRPGASVLDVGAGDGRLLRALSARGFGRIQGLDPFLTTSISVGVDIRVLNTDIYRFDQGPWDIVILSHTFEHMPDPRRVLLRLRSLVAPCGTCILRIPLAESAAHRRYGADWVQLDAPRHWCLHTPRSVELLAAEAGFRVAEVVFDSTAFQFWGSELYRRDIPLARVSGFRRCQLPTYFAPGTLWRFRRRAAALNRRREGDQAAFYLRPLPAGAEPGEVRP